MATAEQISMAKHQNKAIERRFSTQNSKYTYKIDQIRSLNNFVYFLIWLYFILVTIYLAIIFVGSKSSKFSFFYKVTVLIVLVLFPYIISPIEMFIVKMLTFIVETVVGDVFKRPDYEYIIDYSYIPEVFSY